MPCSHARSRRAFGTRRSERRRWRARRRPRPSGPTLFSAGAWLPPRFRFAITRSRQCTRYRGGGRRCRARAERGYISFPPLVHGQTRNDRRAAGLRLAVLRYVEGFYNPHRWHRDQGSHSGGWVCAGTPASASGLRISSSRSLLRSTLDRTMSCTVRPVAAASCATAVAWAYPIMGLSAVASPIEFCTWVLRWLTFAVIPPTQRSARVRHPISKCVMLSKRACAMICLLYTSDAADE